MVFNFNHKPKPSTEKEIDMKRRIIILGVFIVFLVFFHNSLPAIAGVPPYLTGKGVISYADSTYEVDSYHQGIRNSFPATALGRKTESNQFVTYEIFFQGRKHTLKGIRGKFQELEVLAALSQQHKIQFYAAATNTNFFDFLNENAEYTGVFTLRFEEGIATLYFFRPGIQESVVITEPDPIIIVEPKPTESFVVIQPKPYRYKKPKLPPERWCWDPDYGWRRCPSYWRQPGRGFRR